MRGKRFFFILLAAFAVAGLYGIEEEADNSRAYPLNREWPEEGFHLRLSGPQREFRFELRPVPADAGPGIWGLPELDGMLPRMIHPGEQKEKRLGRAVLVLSGFILFETVRYWVESQKWREDWNFRLSWQDQKIRFFTLKANRFDSNPFLTNWTHLISGNFYYSMGRYYNLNHWESLLVSVGSSLWWEYVTEWREVISVNDNLFSGVGGISLGEPLFQIGDYFSRRRGIWNKVIGFIFNPVVAFNDAIAGKKGKARMGGNGPAKPRWELAFGQQRLQGRDEARPVSPRLHIGMDVEYCTIPGYGDPESGSVNRLSGKTLLSEVSLDMAVGAGRVQEFSFFSRAVLGGYFRQKLQPTPGRPRRGYNYFLGLATSFSMFKKAATAYYDRGEYHFDFAADERAPLPTEFADKFAAINLIGPACDANFYAGAAHFHLALSGSADFALVNSLALNAYSLDHDIYEPRMKTTLAHYGYYYAFGATLTAAAGMQIGNVRVNGRCRYRSYGSIEGLDRFQDQVADDGHLRDSRLEYKFSLTYAVAGTPMALGFAMEEIRRRGSVHEMTRRESEQRAYTQLVFSF
jgi:hypothetical protein